MSRVEAAAADRLPWLPDEPAPRRARQRRGSAVVPLAAAAIAAVGALGFWLGLKTVDQPAPPATRHPQPTMTVRLPAPQMVQPDVRIPEQQEIKPPAAVEVRPTPVRDIHITVPSTVRTATEDAAAATPTEKPEEQAAPAAAAPQASTAAAAPVFVMPKPWNPRVFQGAAGRVVQIGAFGSIPQAKHGWWYMVRSYPAVSHLPAVVRPSRNSKGRIFYRFQVGTTSQAHSEVLCQRMQRIRFSCAVVDLPGKAKVER